MWGRMQGHRVMREPVGVTWGRLARPCGAFPLSIALLPAGTTF
jgi:hypothetical protein